MSDVYDLYASLAARGSTPALTWYCPQGRMELSAAVVANHLAKIANFLSEETWTEAGSTLRIELPRHWKSALWAIGGLLAGFKVEVCPPAAPAAEGEDEEGCDCPKAEDADVLVTNHPATATRAREIVAVDMNPLSFGWSGDDLPDGVLDGSAGQISQPDALMDTERHAASNYAEWVAGASLPEGERLLVREQDLCRAITAILIQLAHGSIVVVARKAAERAEIEKAVVAKLER